jgi:hypothetical protein
MPLLSRKTTVRLTSAFLSGKESAGESGTADFGRERIGNGQVLEDEGGFPTWRKIVSEASVVLAGRPGFGLADQLTQTQGTR